MMDKGEIILDVAGKEKQDLTIEKLLQEFKRARGEQFEDDRAVLG
jgi:putative ABC transport system ATP-binding protein